MKLILKPLSEQVIIITGASGEIGLTTAKLAAKKGARIVAAATDEDALLKLSDEINDQGGTAVYVHADMAKEEDVFRVASTSMRVFGTFDTWVNITGESALGGSEELSMDDLKRMFDTNFWGVVYGSRLAASHLKERDVPGAIINVDSFFKRSTAQQAVYSATKHAVQNWTDDLRIELKKEKIPGSVSYIHPRETEPYLFETDTGNRDPYEGNVHAKAVAEAILYCAEHPKREIHIGSRSSLSTVLRTVSPRIMDRVREVTNFAQTRTEKNSRDTSGETANSNINKGGSSAHGLLKKVSKHPVLSTLAFAGLGASIWMWAKRKYKAIENH